MNGETEKWTKCSELDNVKYTQDIKRARQTVRNSYRKDRGQIYIKKCRDKYIENIEGDRLIDREKCV